MEEVMRQLIQTEMKGLREEVSEIRKDYGKLRQEFSILKKQNFTLKENVLRLEGSLMEFEEESRGSNTMQPTRCHCGLERDQGKALEEKMTSIVPQMNTLMGKVQSLNTLQCLLSKQLLNAQTVCETKALVIKDVKKLKDFRDTASRTFFEVELKTRNALKDKEWLPLDKVNTVFNASPTFDEGSGTFTVPTDGVYLLNVNVWHMYRGKLDVDIMINGTNVGTVCTTTVTKSMVEDGGGYFHRTNGTDIRRLRAGQRVTLGVIRWIGKCEVYWCYFQGCLLSL